MENGAKSIPVTIFIPPPPNYPAYVSEGFNGAFLPAQREEQFSAFTHPLVYSHPLVTKQEVGDVKLTLDDLKSHLLSYFSVLYQPEGVDIGERLNTLQKSFEPPSIMLTHHNVGYPLATGIHFDEKSNAQYNAKPLSMLPLQTPQFPQSNALKNIKELNLLKPTTSPSKTDYNEFPDKKQLSQLHTREQNISSDPQQLTISVNKSFSPPRVMNSVSSPSHSWDAIGPPSTATPEISQSWLLGKPKSLSKDFSQVIREIKSDINNATQRLDRIGRDLYRETDDPSLTSFSYSHSPRYKRRPRFGTQREIETHMIQLYQDLYAQVQWNERRIRTLRHRLQALQMNTLSSIALRQDDPRIAL